MLKHIKTWLADKSLAHPLFYSYLVLTFIATLMPTNDILVGGNWLDELKFDKVIHFVIFCTLTILLYFISNRNNYVLFIALVFAISLLIEILQYILPTNRSFDVYDLVANFCGIIAAVFFIKKAG